MAIPILALQREELRQQVVNCIPRDYKQHVLGLLRSLMSERPPDELFVTSEAFRLAATCLKQVLPPFEEELDVTKDELSHIHTVLFHCGQLV